MEVIAGVFVSRPSAETFVERARSLGIGADRLQILMKEDANVLAAEVVTTDAEQAGVGAAIGGVLGGGAFAGLSAIGTLLIPGVGPVIALGAVLAATAAGALGGAAAGQALDASLETGIPADELSVYRDALLHGRTVVLVSVNDAEQATLVRDLFIEHGAESVDAAREQWWLGLRDAAEEEYRADGKDFSIVEPTYRRGYEAAQNPTLAGRPYDEVREILRQRYADADKEPFRIGYERGAEHRRSAGSRVSDRATTLL